MFIEKLILWEKADDYANFKQEALENAIHRDNSCYYLAFRLITNYF